MLISLLLLSFIFTGDPCKHPLFATSTEDLEGHPLTEAFRCLREEDKTNLELAIMYKIEGNEWLQKKTKKSYIESYLRYTHAISFIDKAIIEEENKVRGNNNHGDDNDNDNKNKSDGIINNTTVAFDNYYDNINNNENNSKDNNKDYNNIQELYILKSQLYSNRALTCYNLNNYRRCYLDCDEAIKFYSMNMKAYYRKCQAFIKLKKLNECLLTCNEYLYHHEQQQQQQQQKHDDNNNYDNTKKESSSNSRDIMLKMKEQVQQMILTIEKNKNDSYKNLLTKLIIKWSYVWDICSRYNITLGYPIYSLSEPIELRECWWYNDADDDNNNGIVDGSSGVVDDDNSSMIRCPVLFHYPQYGTYDVITSACVNDCLIDHLAILFPEREDCNNNDQYHHQHSDRHVHWDINDEYHVSNLSIYIQLNITQSIASKQQWLEACMEYYILMQGGNIELLQMIRNERSTSSSTSTNSSGVIDYKKLKSIVDKRENIFFENMNTSDCNDSRSSSNRNQIRFLEVYIGCNFLSIAKAYNISNILSRGIITLIIYPKNHHLHKIFKEQNKNKIGYLHPN
jgi:hypothetical protein